MSTEIRVPVLGESVTEAIVAQWFKNPGDHVGADEPILELETDKVTLEVNSPVEGTLEKIDVAVGDTVEIGALLGAISEGGEVKTAPVKAEPEPEGDKGAVAIKEENLPVATETPAPAAAASAAQAAPAQAAPEQTSQPEMAPAPSAAKMMAEQQIAPETIEGSGKRGQILKEDVILQGSNVQAGVSKQSNAALAAGSVATGAAAASAAQVAQQEAKTPAPASTPQNTTQTEGKEERVRMSKLRQTIATRLKDAQNSAAMLTTFNDVDMSAVMALRSDYKELFEKKHGVRLGFMGFFIKACIQALKDVPEVNAQIDGTDIIYKNYYNIGVAVGTDKGLVVPVVKDADQLSLAGIEKAIGAYGKKARDGKITIEDMQGGTFTLSNGGVYGSLMSTPILNAPQSGILGMHRIEQRPVVREGDVVVRPMMYLALSYDHRIVDGKGAVTFLVRVKEALEDPQRLILEL